MNYCDHGAAWEKKIADLISFKSTILTCGGFRKIDYSLKHRNIEK